VVSIIYKQKRPHNVQP